MARKSDPLSESFGTDEADGWLGGIVADEDNLDRRALWRLGLWGFAAIGALTLGLMSVQFPITPRQNNVAANELAGQTRKVEAAVQENRLEARRLAAAVDTLNGDRDRLFSRLSSLEQGLDSITGSIGAISKKNDEGRLAATPWPEATLAPIVAPITAMPAIIVTQPPPVPAAAPPQPPAVAAAPVPAPDPPPVIMAARSEPVDEAPPAVQPPALSAIQAMPIPDPQPAPIEAETAHVPPIALAEFGVDLGSANSINGLRALWRGLSKSHKAELDGLRPLIAVHERRNGLGLQLRLLAGPLRDAAAAARICAVLTNADRECTTTPFDGQRLALATEPEQKATPARAQGKRRSARAPRPAAEAPPPPAQPSSFSSLLGVR